MKRAAAMLITLAMVFALGCEPPADNGGGGDTDANTTQIETPTTDLQGEGVQLVSLKLPGMS